MSRGVPWRTPVGSLTYLLTSEGWRQEHNGYSHQGPGFISNLLNRNSSVTGVYLPPDANTLLVTVERLLDETGKINAVVAGKLDAAQWLGLEAARAHCRAGASAWDWASTNGGDDPEVVLACAGGIPTVESLHGRPRPDRFHVRGYVEEGTTTTPYDLLALNGTTRHDLALTVLTHLGDHTAKAGSPAEHYARRRDRIRRELRRTGVDPEEITEWKWTACSACAVRDGESAYTTMGFTPLEGLVMSSRSGNVDRAARPPTVVGGRPERSDATRAPAWCGHSRPSPP